MVGHLHSPRIERGDCTCLVVKNGNGVRSQLISAKSVYAQTVRRKKSGKFFFSYIFEGDVYPHVTLFLSLNAFRDPHPSTSRSNRANPEAA